MTDNMNTDIPQEQVLEEFRNTWRQEVKEKHSHDHEKQAENSKKADKSIDNKEEASIANLIEETESLTTTETSVPVTAMDHYVIAVDNERQGKLGKGIINSFFFLCMTSEA
jgi:predicted DNA binding CopG/RHH family protein